MKNMTKNKKTLATLVASSFLLNGCAIHVGLDKKYPGPQQRPPEIEEKYRIDSLIEPSAQQMQEEKNYDIVQLTFSSPVFTYEENKEITIEYYRVKDHHEKHPLIILSPILGGKYGIEKNIARYFAKHDFSCALIHRQKHKLAFGAKDMESLLQQVVADYKQTLNWFENQPEIDTEKVCSVGISMGGIKNAIVSGLDDRLKYNIFILAGSTDEILLKTKEKSIRELVQKASQLSGEEEFIRELTGPGTTNPQHFAKYIDAENALMIIALFDHIVPRSASKKLRNEIGKPETFYIPTGHLTSIIYLPSIKRKCIKFFKKEFKEDETQKTQD